MIPSNSAARRMLLRTRIGDAALAPVDIASLAAFRILFGLVMFGGLIRFLASPWIEKLYEEPSFHFKYSGFSWVQPWSLEGMYVHYGVLALLALAIALGLFYRFAIVAFTIGFLYTQLIDVTNYLNHHYLVVLVGALLAFLPANAAWSLDAMRDPAARRELIPAWMIWLLRFQIGIVYVFAGLAKAKVDWLAHGQPLNLWLAARTETPIVGGLFDEPWFAMVMSWGGFLFDTTIVIWLSWRRTRLPAFVAVIGFHGLTGYLFNIGMFPLIMTSSALIFFSPSWPRHLLARLGAKRWAGSPPELPSRGRGLRSPLSTSAKLAVAAIAIHVVVQIALPLRHHVYPGEVLWNEDGMRFAWHVMIREKHGNVTFTATFPDGKRLEIPARNYLTWRQEREMGAQPDLILQLARHIDGDLRSRGFTGYALHATTAVSLNGRRPSPMIDPAVNLLEVVDVGPRDWVLPAPTTRPPTVRPLR